jgi:hypothetical protein
MMSLLVLSSLRSQIRKFPFITQLHLIAYQAYLFHTRAFFHSMAWNILLKGTIFKSSFYFSELRWLPVGVTTSNDDVITSSFLLVHYWLAFAFLYDHFFLYLVFIYYNHANAAIVYSSNVYCKNFINNCNLLVVSPMN